MVKGPTPFDQGIFLMHLGKGKEYFEKADYQKAREELEAAYHLRPQDEKVLNMLGMTYFKMEMLPQAEEMYVALSANNPDIYTLQSNLGLIRLKLEKLGQAEAALTRALELQPANPKAHFYLGLLYEKLENWDKALFHFEYARADKMVARAKEKIAEKQRKRSAELTAPVILPFEVLEVLADEEREAEHAVAQPVPAPADMAVSEATPHAEQPLKEQEGPAIGSSEWVELGASTGKMRRKDVMDAMKQLEEKEAEEAEELVEDAEIPPVEETEGTLEEDKPWEKTQPTIEASEAEEPEPRITQELHVTTDHFANAAPASSLFLPEDTAADISTFLAQTREEETPESDDGSFVTEPPTANFAVVQPPAPEMPAATESEPFPESRIPTPDEIENATRDFGREAIFVNDETATARTPEEEMTENREEVPAPLPGPPEQAQRDVFEEEEPVAQSPFREQAGIPIEQVGVTREAGHIENTLAMEQSGHGETGPAAKRDVVQPANLDQFSRDRFYIQPLIGADRFLLIDPHLLEIIISDRMVVRKGTISSFTGRVGFTPYANEGVPLVEVAGSGILFLADRRKEIFVISLNNESIYVESNHLLVAQSSLRVEPYELQHGDDVFSTVKISGRGTIAITCQTKPLTLNVYEGMPANIPAEALIAWSGKLATEVVSDAAIYNVMMEPDELGSLLRFSGDGDVVVEQGSLWGDRRLKK